MGFGKKKRVTTGKQDTSCDDVYLESSAASGRATAVGKGNWNLKEENGKIEINLYSDKSNQEPICFFSKASKDGMERYMTTTTISSGAKESFNCIFNDGNNVWCCRNKVGDKAGETEVYTICKNKENCRESDVCGNL